MASVYTIQSNNRLKTTGIVFVFVLLTTLVGYAAGYYFNNYGITLLAFVLAIGQSLVAYFAGDKVALAIARAKAVSDQEAPEIHELVSNLSKIAGIPKPQVFISPDGSANAFACGRGPGDASICLNEGILKLLDKNELEGVIAHELSHIINRDTLVMTVTMVLSSVISLIVDFAFRLSFFGFGDSNNRENNRSPLLLVAGVILMIVAPILALLLQLAVSRSREYLADATAITMTRYPEGLISALQKLYSQNTPADIRASSMSSLYIAPQRRSTAHFIENLFSTHPSIDERIANLRSQPAG